MSKAEHVVRLDKGFGEGCFDIYRVHGRKKPQLLAHLFPSIQEGCYTIQARVPRHGHKTEQRLLGSYTPLEYAREVARGMASQRGVEYQESSGLEQSAQSQPKLTPNYSPGPHHTITEFT